jgi:hypothetical protein
VRRSCTAAAFASMLRAALHPSMLPAGASRSHHSSQHCSRIFSRAAAIFTTVAGASYSRTQPRARRSCRSIAHTAAASQLTPLMLPHSATGRCIVAALRQRHARWHCCWPWRRPRHAIRAHAILIKLPSQRSRARPRSMLSQSHPGVSTPLQASKFSLPVTGTGSL